MTLTYINRWIFLFMFCLFVGGCYTPTMVMNQTESETKQGSVATLAGDMQYVKLTEQTLPIMRPLTSSPMKLRKLVTPKYEYRLGSGDEVAVLMWNGQALIVNGASDQLGFSQSKGLNDGVGQIPSQQINQKGKIFLPYAGQIKIGGLTVEQARARINDALAKIYKNPQADLRITRFGSQRFAVSGRVPAPGIYPLDDNPKTIYDALRVASGNSITDRSDVSFIKLLRKGETFELDLSQDNFQGVPLMQIYLQDGDVIHVPDALDKRIYVLGEVGATRSISLVKQKYSLTEALTDAGGLNPMTANVANIYVMRQEGAEKPLIYHLDASSATSLVLADRFQMMPRDIIYVDATRMAQFGRVASLLSGFFGTIQGAAGSAGSIANPLNR